MKTETYNAGDFDRTITRLARSTVQDAYGERGVFFDPTGEPYPCHFSPGKGNETEDSKGTISTQTDTFVVRFTNDFTPTDRLTYEGKQYVVISVTEGPGRKQYTIIAAQRTDQNNPA